LGLVYGVVRLTEMVESMGLAFVLSAMVVFGFVLTIVIFLIVRDRPLVTETHARQPIPEFLRDVWRVLASYQVWIIGFVGACLYTSLSVFGELWGKTYLEHAHHLTKVEAARTISAMFLGWAVGAPLAGYLSDWSGRRIFPLVLGAALALVCICVVLYWPNLSYTALNVWLFLYGLFSATEIIVFVMAKENCGAKLSGTVLAATNMIVTLGGVIFQPLVGKLLDLFGGDVASAAEHVYRIADYQMALSVLPISLLLVMIIAFFLKDHHASE
jgi:MFS family permease